MTCLLSQAETNKMLGFKKLPLVDVASDLAVLDEFRKNIKISEHESNRNR